MALWLGLDLGTSAAKALLVDDRGTVRASASTSYSSARGAGGIAEQDPSTYLAAARELIATIASAGRPDGIGLCGQTPTLVFIDRDGGFVRPAITWQDLRAGAEAADLERLLGDSSADFGIRLPWSAVYPPAKLLWLKRHEPQLPHATSVILQPKDLVGHVLTGAATSDLWSSRGLRNLATEAIATRVLEAAGWPDSVVPDVAPPWASRGAVTRDAAREYGLPAGIAVSVGWTDALAALLAVGAFDEATAFLISGSADIAGVSAAALPQDPAPLLAVPETCAPRPLVYGPIQTTGAALAWLGSLMGIAGAPEADDEPLIPGSPVFVPYLSGERAPLWRDDVRGAFVGLALEHTAHDLMRAAAAGVVCAGREVLETAESVGGARHFHVRVTGATAASPRSRRLRAAILGRPILVLREPEASALGAAMLAASTTGEPLHEVAARLRGPLDRIEPTDADVAAGNVAFAQYRRARDVALAWADRERAPAQAT
jgi:xylulokinase